MNENREDELKRIRRVSDMMITGHSYLRERYLRLYIITDVLIFLCTIILCVVAFVEQEILTKYLGNGYRYIIGIFSIVTFVFAYLSSKFNWKVRAVEHKNASQKYFEIKKECDKTLDDISLGRTADIEALISKYESYSNMLVKIPENLFLKCKRSHLLKVAISKRLSEHPFTSIAIYRIRNWINDNILKNRK